MQLKAMIPIKPESSIWGCWTRQHVFHPESTSTPMAMASASCGFERKILPMCEAEGMDVLPWGALGSGSYETEGWRQGFGRSLPEIPEVDVTGRSQWPKRDYDGSMRCEPTSTVSKADLSISAWRASSLNFILSFQL
jgi:hypothetical protein